MSDACTQFLQFGFSHHCLFRLSAVGKRSLILERSLDPSLVCKMPRHFYTCETHFLNPHGIGTQHHFCLVFLFSTVVGGLHLSHVHCHTSTRSQPQSSFANPKAYKKGATKTRGQRDSCPKRERERERATPEPASFWWRPVGWS